MDQQVEFNSTPFTLSRYPKNNHDKSLQAWDSADELLLNQLVEIELQNKNILIFNDAFGALACYCIKAGAKVTSVSDSWLSHKAVQANLTSNQIDDNNLNLINCESPLTESADIVLIKIPRTLALLQHQLISLQSVITEATQIIGGAKVKDIHTSTLQMFERYIGETKTSLAKKKSRLIFSNWQQSDTKHSPVIKRWKLDNTDFTISNLANVFSREKLDIGGRFLIENLPSDLKDKKVIDLGCGNGVVGLSILAKEPSANVTFVDESFMAVSSARENVTNNLPEQNENCQFKVNNCLTGFEPNSADIVLCNPPFHQQNTLTEHIAKQMFSDAKKVLKRGGELRIVANSHLPYPAILKRLFGGYRKLASNKKFVILSALQ